MTIHPRIFLVTALFFINGCSHHHFLNGVEELNSNFDSRGSTELPLHAGFYVSSGTTCDKASNATLLLLKKEGIGGSRYFCNFTKISKLDIKRFDVEEECVYFQSKDRTLNKNQYEVINTKKFIISNQGKNILIANYCSKDQLPLPWRNEDIN